MTRSPGVRASTIRRLDYLCLQPTREGQASHAHVVEIVEGLRRRGWAVRLVQPPLPRRQRRLDGVRRLGTVVTTQLRYWLACRLHPAPVVYVRAHFAALPTALLARAAGSTVVQELNGPFEDALDAWPGLRRIGPVVLLSSRAQLRLADAVIVVTDGLVGYVRRRVPRRHGVHVVGNGANVELFRPRTEQPDGGEGEHRTAGPYVLFVGALAPWQGIATILAAAADPAWPPGVDLWIAGDGQEAGRVRGAAAANPRVHWLGTVPYDAAPGLVAGSLAALVPTDASSRARFGASPLKLFEAMAGGVPVVASDLPGLGAIVREHACGIVVPPGDPPALARAVADLAAHPRRRAAMGRRGREAVVARYAWDVRAGETERVILGARRS